METRLPAFTVGMDVVSSETALPSGAVRDALNVSFDREGRAMRREGFVQVDARDTHSLWRSRRTAVTYAVVDGELSRVSATGVEPFYQPPSPAPLTYTDLLDRVVISNAAFISQVAGDTVTPLGIEDCALGIVSSSAIGGMHPGRYGVAASFMRGFEEGPASEIVFVGVQEGGGINIESIAFPADPSITGVRLYRTQPDGDVLYRAADITAGMSLYLLGNTPVGAPCETQYLRQMPPGRIVRSWQGRLLVARGRSVCISEPMRYGLYSPRHGFVQEPHPITMLRPVEGGVYVGTRAGVAFYRGSRPADWTRINLGAAPPVPGSDATVEASALDPRLEVGTTTEVALWLSAKGFVIGTAEGQLLQPQVRRIELSAQRGRTTVIGRRAITLVQ